MQDFEIYASKVFEILFYVKVKYYEPSSSRGCRNYSIVQVHLKMPKVFSKYAVAIDQLNVVKSYSYSKSQSC